MKIQMRTGNWISQLAVALLALSIMTLPLVAQSSYGSVVGTVVDNSQASIAGAEVVLMNTGTSERRTMQTDSSGNYQFVNLVPGTYRVDIESRGFKHLTRDSIQVEVQSVLRVDAAMQIGDVGQTIEVTAQAQLLQTENASVGQVVEGRVVTEMPLNGRNIMNLIALAAGVVPQGQALGRGSNPFSWGNYQISGGLPNQGSTLVDGASVNTTYINLTALLPTQDAVQEFQVQTNNLAPEFGGTANGVVNIATKSGTNQFHGTAYEFLRNRLLNANTFYANLAGLQRPAFTQNQFGATLGGPVKKDKLFLFGSYEGFRLRNSVTTTSSVPTVLQRAGDFSNTRTASGALIPIYDPLTTCGVLNNPACVSGKPMRVPFQGNVIPAGRINNTSNLLEKYWALPNTPGTPFTQTNNNIVNAGTGTDNDQWGIRGDYNMSEKQRIFARFTRWDWHGLPSDPFHVGGGNNLTIVTDQAVVADTYTLSPTTILDVRVAYLRNFYLSLGRLNGTDYTSIGWPSFLNGQISPQQLPAMVIPGFTNSASNGQFIEAVTDSELVSGSVTKILGRHTIKTGGEFRRLPNSYGQTGGSGNNQLTFTTAFTAVNPLSPAGTGNAFASYLLGMGNGGQMVSVGLLAGTQKYAGAYVGDTFLVTKKLTLTYGVRWELPGYWTERYDRLTVFQPGAQNPVLQASGLNYLGDTVLVNSPRFQDRHNILPHWNLFAPRVGMAYRLNDKTAVRAGFGISYAPGDIEQNASPYAAPINSAVTPWVATQNGGLTAVNLLSNPYPNGVPLPVGHNTAYEGLLLGTSIVTPLPQDGDPATYVENWNFSVARQFGGGSALDVAYVGMKGNHLPMGGGATVNGLGYNQIPSQYLSLGSQLLQPVANPFYGLVKNGALSTPTIPYGQLLRPFPQFTGVFSPSATAFSSEYHSLQAKFQQRMGSGGNLLVAYTWAKNTGNGDTATGFLEAINNPATVQNFYDLRSEHSLLSFDVPQRLSVSYVVDLPVGKGKRFLGNVSGVTDRVISGWAINGVTTLQTGFPAYLLAQPTVLSTNLGGGPPRPNVIAGCNKVIDGSTQSRLSQWFNTGCFVAPSQYGFGNESRTDPNLRFPGIANYDFALFKNTNINERFGVQFRAEFFNIFNRVQFGPPGNTLGSAQFGLISTQYNNPRLVQFSMRVNY
jgi:hypothetical protein